MQDKLKVLFLSKGNPARSQMAEGFLNSESGERFVGVSAGTTSVEIDPIAVEVMDEVGIDISGEQTKTVGEIFKAHFAYVVGICDGTKERAPVFPFAYHLERWSLKDPAEVEGSHEEQVGVFRRVRDEIHTNVIEFLKHTSSEREQQRVQALARR